MFAHSYNKRIIAVLVMGFSSGLPLALTGPTLQAWFTQAGVSIAAIGTLTLVGIPYIFKFLWAPILDRFVPPFLGRRRGWIIVAQVGLCLTLLALTCFTPETHPKVMGALALLIAFLSASQDVAYDAYRTDVLAPNERGLGAAALAVGYRVALLISGGLAFIVADHVGWQLTYQWMAGLMLVLSLATLYAPDPERLVAAPNTLVAAVMGPFKNLLQRERIFPILLFIVLYKIGDALALSLMSNFLLRGLGFTLTEVGLAFKTLGLFASITGAVTGGMMLARMRLLPALFLFGLLQAFSNLMFMVLALAGKNYLLMVASLFIEQFCSGMSTAALVAFLMSLCDPRYTATQYALLSALAALGRVFLGPIAAAMVEYAGWACFYGWATIACFPGLIVLMLLRNRVRENAEAVV